MGRGRVKMGHALLALSLGLAACGAPSQPTATQPGPVAASGHVAPTAAPAPTTPNTEAETPLPEGTRLVTDISGSMQGFVEKGSVRLTQLHEEITGALGDLRVGALEFCTVASQVRCQAKPELAHFSEARTYSGGESRFDQALDLLQENGPQTRRLTLILTDGVYGGKVEGDTSQAACGSGASTACISQRLEALSQAGYGTWWVGLRLPFEGRVYAERAMDREQFATVEAHLGPDQQVSDFKASASEASYRYRGTRPLLLMVVSRDLEAGRALVASLEQRLVSLAANPADLHTFELAPLKPEPCRIQRLAFVGLERSDDFLLGQGGFSRDPTSGAHLGYAQHVQCGAADSARLRLEVVPTHPSVTLTPQGSPPAGLVDQIGAGKGIPSLGLHCAALPPGTTDLTLHLTTDVVDRLTEDAWWRAWSATDTWSQPQQLFGLEAIAQAVMDDAATRLPPDDVLYLRFSRR